MADPLSCLGSAFVLDVRPETPTRGQLCFYIAGVSRMKECAIVARTRILLLFVERQAPFIKVSDDFAKSGEDLDRSRFTCQSDKLNIICQGAPPTHPYGGLMCTEESGKLVVSLVVRAHRHVWSNQYGVRVRPHHPQFCLV